MAFVRRCMQAFPHERVSWPLGVTSNVAGKFLPLCVHFSSLKDHKSKFTGVSWNRPRRKWRAQIYFDKRQINLGDFESEEDAARAFDEFAGSLGRPVNFPRNGQKQAKKRCMHGIYSKYTGVDWYAATFKWRSQIKSADGSSLVHLGYFDSEEQAASAYDEVAGPLGRAVNFPDGKQKQAKKRGTSVFLGTSWNGEEWEALGVINGKSVCLGTFDNEVDAARAYDDHLVSIRKVPRVNFPTNDLYNDARRKDAASNLRHLAFRSVADVMNPVPEPSSIQR